MSFGFTQKQMDKITDVFSEFAGVWEVIIFGSRAMGNFKNGSDVDLALKGEIDEKLLNRISRRLNDESTLPYTFDIIIYKNISNQKLKEHIDHFGKTFYKKCRRKAVEK